jgi:hypothetical protein
MGRPQAEEGWRAVECPVRWCGAAVGEDCRDEYDPTPVPVHSPRVSLAWGTGVLARDWRRWR